MGKGLAILLAGVVGVVIVGWIAVSVLSWIGSVLVYLIIGALVIAGGAVLYRKAKRAVAPGTRTQRRIEAARETYRMRNR